MHIGFLGSFLGLSAEQIVQVSAILNFVKVYVYLFRGVCLHALQKLLLSFSVDKEFVIRVEVDQHAVLLLKSESEERLKLFLEPHITVELFYLSKHFIICIRLTARLF